MTLLIFNIDKLTLTLTLLKDISFIDQSQRHEQVNISLIYSMMYLCHDYIDDRDVDTLRDFNKQDNIQLNTEPRK